MSKTDSCCEQCGAQAPTTTDARWIGERPVHAGTLPVDLATAASEFYGAGPVETLEDFVEATRAAAGGAIEGEQLCHADGETAHRAATGSETYHFRCFYDGIVLARLRSEPVDVRTESPSGAPVEFHVSADGAVDVSPADAVMSLGIAPGVTTADGNPTPEDVYGSVCPWVKAFPSRAEYEGWAAATDAATVGLPLEAGLPVAAALTEER